MADEKATTADASPASGARTTALRGAVGSPLANTLTIAGREFRAYFTTPIGYIIVALFVLLLGVLFFFVFGVLVTGRESLQPMFLATSWLLVILAPAITMRSFAEERRLGTIELLITLPVRDGEVIVGKFLGAMGLLLVMFATTLVYPIAMSRMGDLDWGPVWGGYVGLILGGGAYVAFGLLLSSYSRDQITAFFGSLILLAIPFFLEKGLLFLGGVAQYIEYALPDTHFKSIARGVIDSRDVIFFGSVMAACLLATSRALNSRRWS